MIRLRRRHSRQGGSLLLEISVAVAIMAVLGMAVLSGLSGADRERERKQADASLDAAADAVRSFVLREKRLPCPATDNNGYEDCATASDRQLLPYVSLGIDRPELPQGVVVRYAVSQGLSAGGGGNANALVTQLTTPTAAIPRAGQPFTAGIDAGGRAVNCAAPASFPAYVLSVAPAAVNPLCFADSGDTGPRLRATSRIELLGWVRARLP